MRRSRRGRSDKRPDAARLCRFEGPVKSDLVSGGDGDGRPAAGRNCPTQGSTFCVAPAQDAIGQDIALLDSGRSRGTRSRRPHHHRRSQRFGTDQKGTAPMKTRPILTLDDCKKISAAAEAEAKKNNWNVCIAVLDDGGHLLHLARMDGASPANARIAIAKGRTAAESRRSTQVWEERIKAGRNSMLGMPGITPVQGGLPIMAEGICVGGI